MSAIVGVIGKKRSGKDSFASTLIEERGFQRFAFADPLKESVLSVNPLIYGESYVSREERVSDVVESLGWEGAKEIPEVRRLLQEYGLAIREIQPDFWIRATMERVLDHATLSGPVVVTDVRFPNEAEEIRRAKGTLVRITRPGLKSDDSHISETALDDYDPDHVVVNSGTLEDLAAMARGLAL